VNEDRELVFEKSSLLCWSRNFHKWLEVLNGLLKKLS
jgi:hypothetical protein